VMSESTNDDDLREEITQDDYDEAIEPNKAPGKSIFSRLGDLKEGKNPSNPLATQNSLKMGFLITLLFGSACIYIFRNTGVWNIGVCLVVMCAYWRFAEVRIHTSGARAVFADSFYYLGFLFTFVALIITMVGLDTETGSFSAKAIIGQIGPALATTVVGMAVRIYITQFDAITSEPEAEVITGLGELSNNLSSALSELQKMIAEHSIVSTKQQERSLELTQKFSNQVEKLDFQPALVSLKYLSSEVNKLNAEVGLLSHATSQIDQQTSKMTSSVFRTTLELDKAALEFSRYKEINEDFDDARTALVTLSESATELNSEIQKAQGLDILRTLTDLDSRANTLDQHLEESNSQIKKLGISAKQAEQDLAESLHLLDEASIAVTEVTDQMNQLSGLSSDLVETKNAVLLLRQEVQKINTQITHEIQNTKKELGKTTEQAAKILKEQVQPITIAIQKVSTDFDPIQENLKHLDLRVKKSIGDVLDFLNKRDAGQS
jgi:hypothetical protein